jgi:hypothetical protein
MNANDWAGLALAISTLIGSFGLIVRWLVKHYLSELKPDGNGGHNLEGRITRLETRVDQIYLLLCEKENK